jgi:hypothetical protein
MLDIRDLDIERERVRSKPMVSPRSLRCSAWASQEVK